MADKLIAQFGIKVLKLESGELLAEFEKPTVDTGSRYDYCRLLLLGGEIIAHVKKQIMYLNVDPEDQIRKLSKIIIDDVRWGQLLKDRDLEKTKGMSDVEKYQQPLPFKEDKDVERDTT